MSAPSKICGREVDFPVDAPSRPTSARTGLRADYPQAPILTPPASFSRWAGGVAKQDHSVLSSDY